MIICQFSKAYIITFQNSYFITIHEQRFFSERFCQSRYGFRQILFTFLPTFSFAQLLMILIRIKIILNIFSHTNSTE